MPVTLPGADQAEVRDDCLFQHELALTVPGPVTITGLVAERRLVMVVVERERIRRGRHAREATEQGNEACCAVATGKAVRHDDPRKVRLLRTHGPAIFQLRSRTGFLRRLFDNDELISVVRDAWERPIRGVLRQLDIPDEHFNHALFLHNVLFDPREVFDLIEVGMEESEAVTRLVGAFYGALQGWAEPGLRAAQGRAAAGS